MTELASSIYRHGSIIQRLRSDRLVPTWRDLFSVECLFVAFLFSGEFKMLPELSFFPIDLTVFCFVSVAAAYLWAFLAGRLEFRFGSIEFLYALLSILAWISIVWSSFSDLNIDKLLRYVLFTMPAFFIGGTLGRQPERAARFIRLLIGVSILLLLYYSYYRFVLGVNLTDKLADYYANNYLEYSWHASYLFIILCVYVVFAVRPRFIWGYLGAVLSLAGLFLIGGRGPMLFGLLAIPLMLLSTSLRRVGFAGHTKRLVFYVVGIALVGIGGYYAALASGGGSLFGQDLVTVQRLELSLSGESTFSMDAREEAQRAAVSFWQERPFFGWGIGEFRVKHWLKYPHNLLIEVLMELGIVGAVIFVSLCAMIVRRCFRIMAWPSAPWQSIAISTLVLCSLASHLTVQGYLADDRAFLALMGLAAGLTARRKEEPVRSVAPHASVARPVWHRS
jgi:O-antigen ligase